MVGKPWRAFVNTQKLAASVEGNKNRRERPNVEKEVYMMMECEAPHREGVQKYKAYSNGQQED